MQQEFAGPRSLRRLLDAVLSVGSHLDLPSVLKTIVAAAVDLVDARYGALGVLDENRTGLAEFITVGLDDEERAAIGPLPQGHGILGLLIVDPRPLRLPDLREHADSYGFPPNHPPMRSFLGVPILVREEVFGNLYLTDKVDGKVFTAVDEELAVGLAAAAGIAIENARLHARVQDLALLEDRERIARDLHDTVIQRLFATGLSLQGTMRLSEQPEVVERVGRAVDDLDLTIKHIRTAIFGLETARAGTTGALRERVLALAHEASGALGFSPSVSFEGPVDTAVDSELTADVVASLREALSNVARHARAGHVEISVAAGPELTLVIEDNGVGPPGPDATRGNGLRNMEARAARHGGACSIKSRNGGGTLLEWKVPLGATSQ